MNTPQTAPPEDQSRWPDRRLIDLLSIAVPIIQAPMAGANDAAMAAAVSEAGGLGSLPCAMLTPDRARSEYRLIRRRTQKPVNMNFFCHTPPAIDPEHERRWRSLLAPYYSEFGIDPDKDLPQVNRAPFDDAMCEVVEDCRPQIISFHFGLPAPRLLGRVKAAGCKVLASATTVEEARHLAEHGCDAIIAQGQEAGGHRGVFLGSMVEAQPGVMALVPQVVDAVEVPVIAAGGIADGRGIAAAFALGASGVQIGSAYLLASESIIGDLHRAAIEVSRDDQTALTNLFSGRPARGLINRIMQEIGPISPDAPPFPTAAGAIAPLRTAAETTGSSDFTPLWSGQALPLSRRYASSTSEKASERTIRGESRNPPISAATLTRALAEDALSRLGRLANEVLE
ncbi:NAD(P)H-dependent flavin oxidoreductase [Thioalkalivibrio sp. HK1]|uniref:NAD(P)H-dependent flavin oxidoreductase n=1 Tax=Thioalkalivibrio sp. HK1 TaxID=1469245 RepID=UPI000471F425|nr:nitronate monooxygenase [Thioalkalivibrio sp. HK1]